MKKILTGVLIIILTLSGTCVIGCNNSDEQSEAERDKRAEEMARKALEVKPPKYTKVPNPFGGEKQGAPAPSEVPDKDKEEKNP